MRFQPVNCNMMQLPNKRINKTEASYTLEDTVLENVDSIKYLGVTITNDLKRNTHITNICTKRSYVRGNVSSRALPQLLPSALVKRICDGPETSGHWPH